MPTRRRSPRRSDDAGGAPEFIFDEAAARSAEEFIERLRLRIGDWAGEPFRLLPWQRKIVRDLFGWKRSSDGKRRYRRVSIWLPRGNGKTPFAAAIALCLLFTSGESAAEIYSVAADRDQAQISFEDGAAFRRQSKALSAVSSEFKRSITYSRRGSSWRVLSSESKTKHGTRPYAVLFDELHTQESRKLFEAMETGLGKRKDSLLITISTAGVYDPESLAWTEYSYARKVADGAIIDESFLPMIFEASADADPFARETWAAANPGLGITVHEHALEDEARKARENPAALASFLQFRLNIWVRAQRAAIDLNLWNKGNATPRFTLPADVWLGLDIGERDDLSALGIWHPNEDGTHSVACEVFVPRAKIVKLERSLRVPLAAWIEAGIVQVSGETNVDVDDIRRRVRALAEIYNVREIAFDPWNAYKLATQLAEEDGFTTVEIRQGAKSLSEPTKDFLTLVEEGRILHGGSAPLRWFASNLVLRRDANGNVCPQKQSKAQKIDGITALLNAWARARLDLLETKVISPRVDIV